MRVRLARGFPRHSLRAWLDFKDFVFNRTDGTPYLVFKAPTARLYSSAYDDSIIRTSTISEMLTRDALPPISGLSALAVQRRCTNRVWRMASQYQKFNSNTMSTQISLDTNTLTGEMKRARIYDQLITWADGDANQPFDLKKIVVYCDCKHFFQCD